MLFDLADRVPAAVTDLRVTGFDDQGRVLFGPIEVDKAAQVDFDSIDPSVTRIQIEYLQDETLVGIGSSPVALQPGGVTVLENPEYRDVLSDLSSIVVTPAQGAVPAGLTRQYTATGRFADGSQVDLSNSAEWSVEQTDIASIDSRGLLSALQPGQTQVSASLRQVIGSATVTVSEANVTSLVIAPAVSSMATGTEVSLGATAFFSDGGSQSVTDQAQWSSSQPGIAAVNGQGVVSALATGQSQISASFGGFQAQADVVVTSATLQSISVGPANEQLPLGLTEEFTATGNYSDGSQQNLTNLVTWQSTAPGIASVDQSGTATALNLGQTDIRATLGSVTGEASLTVTAAVQTSLELTPASVSIARGYDQQFTARAFFSDGTSENVSDFATWNSTAPSTATVSMTGLAEAIVAGQTTIEASFGGDTASATLFVTDAVLTGIAVEPPDALSTPGTKRQYTAIGTFSDNTTQDLTSAVTWTSDSLDVTLANQTLGPDVKGRASIAPDASRGSLATVTATLGSISGQGTLRLNHFLYSTSPQGVIHMLRGEADGSLTPLGTEIVDTQFPSNLMVDPSGRYLAVTVAVSGRLLHLRINDDGTLQNLDTEELENANAVSYHPNGRFLYASSGTENFVTVYAVGADGALTRGATVPSQGFGPYAMAPHPTGSTLYVINSVQGLDGQNNIVPPNITSFAVADDGELTVLDTVSGGSPVEMVVSADGQRAYVAELGQDQITSYGVEDDGSLAFVAALATGGVNDTYGLALTPDERYIFVPQFSQAIVNSYGVNSGGVLEALSSIGADLGAFLATIDPTGRYLYVNSFNTDNIETFAIAADGTLSSIHDEPLDHPRILRSTP